MKRLGFFLTVLISPALFASDPSSSPVEDPIEPEKFGERFRLHADLDGDGLDDLLLSEPTRLFGKMGGAWTVYLKRRKSFKEVGFIDAHPKAISIEPDFERIRVDAESRIHARIWVYLRGGGGQGAFGYFRIDEKSVDKMRMLQIYPGDSGTVLGRAIYKATFSQSPIPFRVEFSETSPEGKVTWKPYDR